MNIGFIGLGTMGSLVAGNLVKAGHQVRVWNRTRASMDALARLGAQPVASAHDAFSGEAAFSMLADDAAVHEVIDGLLEDAPKGLIHVNLATISIPLARDLAARHTAHGLAYVAAPVFGRPELAAVAKLNVVAGGDSAAIDHVQPLLDVIGQHTWRVGSTPEQANVVKLAGNLVLAAAVEALCEAAVVASRNGVSTAVLMDILTNGVFPAPAYKLYGNLIAEERFEQGGFRISLVLKDLRLALAAADAAASPLPLANVIHDTLLEAVANGDGDRDLSALARVARHHAGLATTPNA